MPDVIRDDEAVACRMDRAGRLWVAISRRSERCLAGVRGSTSKLTIYVHLNMGAEADQVLGSGAWAVGEPIGAVCESHGREFMIFV